MSYMYCSIAAEGLVFVLKLSKCSIFSLFVVCIRFISARNDVNCQHLTYYSFSCAYVNIVFYIFQSVVLLSAC